MRGHDKQKVVITSFCQLISNSKRCTSVKKIDKWSKGDIRHVEKWIKISERWEWINKIKCYKINQNKMLQNKMK